MKRLLSIGFTVSLLTTPLTLFAAEVSHGNEVMIGGKTYSVNGDATETVVTNGGTFQVKLSSGESITFTSPDTTKLSFSGTPPYSETCGSTYSVRFEQPSYIASTTFSVSAIETTCSNSSGGGGGGGIVSSGGGGGGGGSSYYYQTPTPTPAPTPTPTPGATPPVASGKESLTVEMSFGDQSEEVEKLQTWLAKDVSIYPEGLASGYFGPATQRAVRAFQAKYGLPVVGRVGPMTLAKLNQIFGGSSAPTPTPTPTPTPAASGAFCPTKRLAYGMTDSEVSSLQTFLAALGTSIYPEATVSGYFGPATQRAVRNYQAAVGLDQVGAVGPATTAKMCRPDGTFLMSPAPVPASTDMSALEAKLKALQDQLKQMQGQ